MAKYIAAVSGGPDSMSMLDMFKKHIVLVCHVNYHKRPTAQRDTTIVEKYCEMNHLKLQILDVTKAMYKRYQESNNNFQSIARAIRCDFFNQCAKKIKVDAVLIAHTKDDFLETAMMQKKRNSATLFLGIQDKSSYKSLNIYRPLLKKWKEELIEYCNNKQIVFGLDETNDSDAYERNKVRKAMSLLSKQNKTEEYKRIQAFNREHKKERLLINNEFNLWKYLSYDMGVFQSLQDRHKYYVIYLLLKSLEISTINKDKIDLIIQWIKATKKNTSLRIDNDLYLKKVDRFIKVAK